MVGLYASKNLASHSPSCFESVSMIENAVVICAKAQLSNGEARVVQVAVNLMAVEKSEDLMYKPFKHVVKGDNIYESFNKIYFVILCDTKQTN